ncbi:putative CENPB DNA-binding domain-containing protein 1 isoform X1 [Augochlora pura]
MVWTQKCLNRLIGSPRRKVKVKIWDRLLKGEKASHIEKSLNLNEATVRTIKKNDKEIRSTVAAGSSTSAKYAARPQAPIIEKMEKTLSIWINDSCQKRIPLDGNVIKQNHLKFTNILKNVVDALSTQILLHVKVGLKNLKSVLQLIV